jgi:hypothetical protein
MQVNTVKEYLEMIVSSKKISSSDNKTSLHKYWGIEDFVHQNGMQFSEIIFPDWLLYGRTGECFKNAFELVLRYPSLTYCEGYAASFFHLHHAWCVTSHGEVVDPTWRDGSTDYFGIPFHFDYVHHVVCEKKSFGLLGNFEMNYPLLTGEHDPAKENIFNASLKSS